jgi:hypothetical protein
MKKSSRESFARTAQETAEDEDEEEDVERNLKFLQSPIELCSLWTMRPVHFFSQFARRHRIEPDRPPPSWNESPWLVSCN